MWKWIRQRAFTISTDEIRFEKRGFHLGPPQARERLEAVASTFLDGYHAAIEFGCGRALEDRLEAIAPLYRGYGYEGAAMGLALQDWFTPWKRRRFRNFIEAGGSAHIYMSYVGFGWALARLPVDPLRALKRLDPLLGWLAVDGYGFHEGFFNWRRAVRERRVPGSLHGYARHVFDQGLGRSLWFVDGADVTRIPETIESFPEERRADLWTGLALACTYTGGVERGAIEQLRSRAKPYQDHLAQGAAFAAQARRRAGNSTPHTELACEILCGISAEAAARITQDALAEPFKETDLEPGFRIWKRRIRESLKKSRAAVSIAS